jgi:hypothetical protein
MNIQAEAKANVNGMATSVYELSVPTCSYRMGVPNMGYGMLTINSNGKAYFSILWLPSRFNCLYLYLLFLLGVSFYFVLKMLFRKILYRFMRIFYKAFAF